MKIGVQLYSVRDEMEKDFFGTLKLVKEMGYDGCEFAGLYGNSPSEIHDACKKLGLEPISAHVAYQDIIPDIGKIVKEYKEIGCKYIVIPYLPEDLRYGTEKYPTVVEDIKKIAKVCNENGVTLLYHNHDFEFAKDENGEYVLDRLYKEVSEELLKTEIDTCWVGVAGEDPSSYVRKYTGRAPLVHLKDYVGSKNDNMYKLIGIESEDKKTEGDFELRPVGYGKQNFKEILKASEEAGAIWVITEQDSPSMGLTSLECMRKSIDYLKTI